MVRTSLKSQKAQLSNAASPKAVAAFWPRQEAFEIVIVTSSGEVVIKNNQSPKVPFVLRNRPSKVYYT